jgi:hypothetical protein
MLTLDPSNFKTQVRRCSENGACAYTPLPFNFADLQDPIPASAYFADDGILSRESPQALFNGRLVNTIVHGNYWPTIALPEAITSIDPELFKTCSVETRYRGMGNRQWKHPGIFDPPIVLSPLVAATITVPTVPLHTSGFGELQEEVRPAPNVPFVTATVTHQPNHHTAMIASRSTITALPSSIHTQIGFQALQAGKPPLNLGDTIISRASDGKFVVDSPETWRMGRAGQAPGAAHSKSTLTYLPDLLITRIGLQVLQPGGEAVTIDGTIISRDGDGNFEISPVDDNGLATNTARRKSGVTRNATPRLSHAFLLSLFGVLLSI